MRRRTHCSAEITSSRKKETKALADGGRCRGGGFCVPGHSLGVQAKGFDVESDNASRYKLFNDEGLREVVFRRLQLQFCEWEFCAPNPSVKLCLACGKIDERSREAIGRIFVEQGWELWDEQWLRERLGRMPKDMKTKFLRSFPSSCYVARYPR